MSTAPAPPAPRCSCSPTSPSSASACPTGCSASAGRRSGRDFGVPTEAVGLVLTAGTAGYLTSSVLAGFTLARLGVGWLLAGSTLLASLALTGYGAEPRPGRCWSAARCCSGWAPARSTPGSTRTPPAAFGPRHMNWMHAFFGLGVAIGPLIMTGALSAGLAWRLGVRHRRRRPARPGRRVRAHRAGLAGPAPRRARPPDARPARPRPGRARRAAWPGPGRRCALPAVWLGALAFARLRGHRGGRRALGVPAADRGAGAGRRGGRRAASRRTGAASSWGGWCRGWSPSGWAAARVLRGSLLGMAAGAALIAVPGPAWLAVAGLVVVGFAAAPVFPLLTLTTAERVGAAHADRAIGLQIGAAGLGARAGPGRDRGAARPYLGAGARPGPAGARASR